MIKIDYKNRIPPFLIALVTILVYWQIQHHDFINYDDPGYIYQNVNVTAGFTYSSIKWAFSSYSMGIWHPVTWMSHIIDFQLFGLNPRYHHLSALLIHTINIFLCYKLFNKLSGSTVKSIFITLIFALHPLHVEPVAWLSSRKDLLSGLFFFLMLISYSHYRETKNPLNYALMTTTFLIGIMCKPMLVTAPVILLLIDYWKMNIWENKPAKKLIVEKIPLLCISIIFSFISIYTQHQSGVVAETSEISISYRIMHSITAYCDYLKKILFPVDLTILYPLKTEIALSTFIISALFLIIISVIAISYRNNYRFFIVCWLWFIIMMLPVIGIFQIGIQSITDRYCYISTIPVSIILIYAAESFLQNFRYRGGAIYVSAVILTIAMSTASFMQLRHWKNSVTILTRAVALADNVPLLHNNLALALAENGKYNEGLFHLKKAISLNPKYIYAYFNMGLIYETILNYQSAKRYYLIAKTLAPNNENIDAALLRVSK